MFDATVTTRTQEVLETLNAALAAGDVTRVKALFATDSYWRDLVSVTWNLKTVEGPDGVADMLSHQLPHTQPGPKRDASLAAADDDRIGLDIIAQP